MYNSVLLSTFIMMCNHNHYLVPENFIISKVNSHTLRSHPFPPFSQLFLFQRVGNNNLLSISVGFHILDISYKLNHIICGFFGLTLISIMFLVFINVIEYRTAFLLMTKQYYSLWA